MNFYQKLTSKMKKNNSLLCVGLDSDLNKIPEHLKSTDFPLTEFNKAIIDSTIDIVCSYKIQIAYYAALGIHGHEMLRQTIDYIRQKDEDMPIILDAKRGDIGETSEKYATEVFDTFFADAVTVNPYLGFDSVEPFLKRKDKGVIVLCRTSNRGAKDFQDLHVISSHERETLPAGRPRFDRGRQGSHNGTEVSLRQNHDRNHNSKPLYLHIAEKVVAWHNTYGNCMLVVGATWPDEMKKIRDVAKDLFFLVPGIGAQGGDLEGTLKNGLIDGKTGLLIHAARSIIYASASPDFAEKARQEVEKLQQGVNKYRT